VSLEIGAKVLIEGRRLYNDLFLDLLQWLRAVGILRDLSGLSCASGESLKNPSFFLSRPAGADLSSARREGRLSSDGAEMTFDLAFRRAHALSHRRLRHRRRIADDIFAREKLLDASFGPARFLKTCEKLRAGVFRAGPGARGV